jgi:hypothetical protein
LLSPRYYRRDRTEMVFIFGLMDEGGHRRADVHYICRHFPVIRPYKGASSKSADPIRRSTNDIHFMGDTQYWSEIVQSYMESDEWFLPKDIGKDYLEQVVAQYNEKKINNRGTAEYVWVKGGDDHYRDCENLIMASAHIMNLPEKLNDPTRSLSIREAAEERAKRLQIVQEEASVTENNNSVVQKINPFKNRIKNNPFANRRR